MLTHLDHEIVSRNEWLNARRALLVKEKAYAADLGTNAYGGRMLVGERSNLSRVDKL